MRKGIVNHRNYETASNPRKEENKGVSMTIPDQVMSVEKIIERFVVRGEVFAGTFQGVFTENEGLPDGIEHWTEQDKMDWLRESKRHTAAVVEDIKTIQKDAKRKKKAEEEAQRAKAEAEWVKPNEVQNPS